MEEQEKREQVIQDLSNLLRRNPFTFELKVVKKPKGIKVIYEVTQEELNAMIEKNKPKEE